MASIGEQIIAKVVEILEDAGIENVFRSRQIAIKRNLSTAVLVRPGSEVVELFPGVGQWTLTVTVRLLASGEIPDQLADDLVVAIHAALMADIRLGGLAILVEPDDRGWEFGDAEVDLVTVTLPYRITYRTAIADLTQAA